MEKPSTHVTDVTATEVSLSQMDLNKALSEQTLREHPLLDSPSTKMDTVDISRLTAQETGRNR
jgi:hypothetical protein